LTAPIKNDGILARQPGKTPPAADRARHDSDPVAPATTTDVQADSTDVSRARQRLLQETRAPDMASPSTAQEARDLVGQLQRQMADDGVAALRAMGLANRQLFEAATAPPTA
jgi:hypothetical protein